MPPGATCGASDGRHLGNLVAVTAAQIVVLVVGTLLSLAGVAIVLRRELASSEVRRRVSAGRDLVELLLPALGLVLLVVLAWRTVG